MGIVNDRGGFAMKRWGRFVPGKRWWGFERSTVAHEGRKYLDRWILYVGGGTLRLHKFWRGDDDRASHTHPWWFWTFPLSSYVERVFSQGVELGSRVVRAGRPHFRSASFEHIVVGRLGGSTKPFWTIVISGTRVNAWGFYPKPGEFIYWKEYQTGAK